MLLPLRNSLAPLTLPRIVAAAGGTPGGTAAITSNPVTPSRNNFDGYVGFAFTPSTTIYAKSLGRWKIAGNSQSHTVKIVNASTGLDVAGASVSVDMSTATAGAYAFVTLPSPITLASGSTYYVVSLEVAGGDSWFDRETYTASSSLSIHGAVFQSGGVWNDNANAGESYVPPNFLYDLTP